MGIISTRASSRHHLGFAATARGRLVVAAALLAVAAIACLPLVGAQGASAAPQPISQCNGTDNSTNEAVECRVLVTNTINVATGVMSSSTTIIECHGFANAEPTCLLPQVIESNDLVLSVTQCNGSGNGTGSTVICSVEVVNNIVGAATPETVTINQCQGSAEGGGTFLECSSLDSTDPSTATVVQCNGSGNGGGGGVTCTVDGGSTASAIPTTVNQCVGSGNAGGAFVTCSVSYTTTIVPVDGGGTTTDGGTTSTGTTSTGTTSTGTTSTGTTTTGTTTTGTTTTGGGTDGGTTGGGTTGDGSGPGDGSGTTGTTTGSGTTTGTGTGGRGAAGAGGTLANTGGASEPLLFAGAAALVLGLIVMVGMGRSRRHVHS